MSSQTRKVSSTATGRRSKQTKPPRVARPLRTTNELTLTRRSAPIESFTNVSTSSADVWIPGGLSFQAADFNNIAEVTPLFEEYRINWVQVDFMFAGSNTAMADTYFAFMPFRLCTVVDYDDDSAPAATLAGWNQLNERHGARNDVIGSRFVAQVSRRLSPKVLTELYRSSTTTAYSPTAAPFIDAEKTDVPHYGLKYSVMVPKTASGSSAWSLRFDAVVTYNITFKGVH